MRGIFSYDSRFTRTLGAITDCMLLSLLWLITSLPIVTAGASSTALYYAVHKTVRYEEGGVWKAYWNSFRSNFKQVTLLWLVLAVVYFVLFTSCYCAYLMYSAEVLSSFLFWTVIIVLAAFTMWVNYLFPYIARFSDTTKQTLKNCFWICLMNPLQSILLLVLFAAALALAVLVPLGLAFAPALYALLGSYILEAVFKKYLPDEDPAG